MAELKPIYDKLAQQHNLPSFDNLVAELDLGGYESEHPLAFVIERMKERLEFWNEILNDVLAPDQGDSAALYESRFFNEEDHEKFFIIFKRIMLALRTLDEAEVLMSVKSDAVAIKAAWQDWATMKAGVAEVASRLKECWEKKLMGKNNLGYLG